MMQKQQDAYGMLQVYLAAYFSAIMSNAGNCMMASSGNFVNNLIEQCALKPISEK